MAILGSLLKRTFELTEKIPKLRKVDGYKQQSKVLKKLLTKAEFTAFGTHYNFSKLLSESDVIPAFRDTVHTHDYNSIFKKWCESLYSPDKSTHFFVMFNKPVCSSRTQRPSPKNE